ncbi:septum formation initiator family protein [Candidatus Bipolaricaulota bacterium]|nr:septum formation initiator family protein [Candidatus Bipolaricaulota bacterium]
MAHNYRTRDLAILSSHPRRVARSRAQVISVGVALSVAGAVLIAGLCLLYVGQGVRITELTAQRAGAQAQLAEVEELNLDLGFRIEQAFSLERVARIAREQLGMVEPTVIRYVPVPTSEDD